MPAITVQQVNITGFKYYLVQDGVKTEITEEEYNSPEPFTGTKTKQITFDTPTGELSDGQYAVQENGYVWGKIPKYVVIKMPPEYVDIPNSQITDAGIAWFKANSVLERDA
jgi:hypothetical protein